MATSPDDAPQPTSTVEQKIAPGVYFTPAPSRVRAAGVGGGAGQDIPAAPSVDDMTREELECEYRSISKSVEKLTESNELMRKFDPTGADSVLVDAIRENIDIIVRRRLRLVSVKARLDYLIRTQPHIKPSKPDALAARLAQVTALSEENVPTSVIDAAKAENANASNTDTDTNANASASAIVDVTPVDSVEDTPKSETNTSLADDLASGMDL